MNIENENKPTVNCNIEYKHTAEWYNMIGTMWKTQERCTIVYWSYRQDKDKTQLRMKCNKLYTAICINCIQTEVTGHWVAGFHNGCKLNRSLWQLWSLPLPLWGGTNPPTNHPSAGISFTKALLCGLLVLPMNLPWNQNPIVSQASLKGGYRKKIFFY